MNWEKEAESALQIADKLQQVSIKIEELEASLSALIDDVSQHGNGPADVIAVWSETRDRMSAMLRALNGSVQ